MMPGESRDRQSEDDRQCHRERDRKIWIHLDDQLLDWISPQVDAVGQVQGTVYPLLNRLHDAGFVTSYWEVNDTDRPRRYYQLTEGGRQELESFQEDWERFSGSVTSFLATIPEKHNDRTRDDV